MLSVVLGVYKLKYLLILLSLLLLHIVLNLCSIFVDMKLLSILYLSLYLVGSHDVSSKLII